MLALVLLYLALGGSFAVGQAVLSEVGRYELWDKKRRFLWSFAIGMLIFLISSASLLFEKWTYPFMLFGLIAVAKFGMKSLNRLMPERFQPTGEELKQKYIDMFRVDTSEIEEILKGEQEFLEKLGMKVELPKTDEGEPEALPKKDTASELKELGKAIKKFLERDEKWE
jgi:hypothetical protein